jgi:hypothetical protein
MMTDDNDEPMEAYVPVRAMQAVALRLFRDKLEATRATLKELEAALDEATMEKVGMLMADLMTMGVVLSLHMDPDGSRFDGMPMGDAIQMLASELAASTGEERTLN